MQVNWTDKAKQHLRSIYEHIGKDSEFYAIRVVDRLTARSLQLINHHQSGRKVPEFNNKNLRDLIEGSYRIVYCVYADRIDVIAVFHGAQQLPDRF